MKELVRRNFPRFFALARNARRQITVEGQVLRQVGPRVLVERLLPRKGAWHAVLPLQVPRSFVIEGLTAETSEELVRELRDSGVPFAQGGHTIYVPPASLVRTPFCELAREYPPDAGLKIVKNPGGPVHGDYLHGSGVSVIHRTISHNHLHLALVANVLHAEGLGPPLYDLIELRFGRQAWTAYVVAHCTGREPTAPEWAGGIQTFKQLERNRVLKVTAPLGYGHMDFRFPDCNGNCLVDAASGKFQFFDFQNFVLTDYGAYLRSVAQTAAPASHFGDRSVFRGGRYLYASVPGVELPAKRSTERRIAEIERLMIRAGVDVRDRLVLDFGCNLGMMMAQYLRLGARWAHGWDMDDVVPHTRRLLWALGCTRFSLTAGRIASEQAVEAEVPSMVRRSLDGCAISYLAVRGHIGWLQALGRIPWSFMVYEGHERDVDADFEMSVAELEKLTRVRVGAAATYRDGDSRLRKIAIVVREG